MKHFLLLSALLFAFAHTALGQRSTNRQRISQPGKSGHAHTIGAERGSAPANDDCANAEVITVSADCSAPITGTTTDATFSGNEPYCDEDSGPYQDVWYTVNAGAEAVLAMDLVPADPNTQDWGLAVYDVCGGADLFCIILPGAPQNVPVTAGADYWIRVWSNIAFGEAGPFTLCVTPGASVPVPPNDLCTNVVVQPLAIGGSVVVNGTNEGALDNELEGCFRVWKPSASANAPMSMSASAASRRPGPSSTFASIPTARSPTREHPARTRFAPMATGSCVTPISHPARITIRWARSVPG
ncbi:MAG: hypothetical protein IPJ85_18460 [Flavobacteriales bacterium]|nr:hypothetical protein [Flavobacteriales bacterium]